MMWGHSEFGPQQRLGTATFLHRDFANRFEEAPGGSGLTYDRMQRLPAGCSQLVGGLYLANWVLGTGEG